MEKISFRTGPACLAATLLYFGLLSGCASIAADHGYQDVRALASARGAALPEHPSDATQTEALLDRLVSAPLTADSAAQIALVNNPGLRAEYARLGIASAAVYDAGRLSNPELDATIQASNIVGRSAQVSLGIAQNFTELLLLPSRSRFASGELQRVKALVGARVLALVAETQRAYYDAVSAQQVAAMRALVAENAEISAALAQRYFDAGNFSRLQMAMERAAASESRIGADQAKSQVAAARARLNDLLGLRAEDSIWRIEGTLPLPVENEDDPASLQALAAGNRLDLTAAQQEVALYGDALRIARHWAWLGVVSVGVERDRESDGEHLLGPSIAVQLPIFNQGRGSVVKLQSQAAEAEAQLAELKIAASNAVALAAQRVAAARDIHQRYQSDFVPQRDEVSRRIQEQANDALASVFDLLRARQQQADAYQGDLESLRDYWIARTDLAAAIGRSLPSDSEIKPGGIGPQASTAKAHPSSSDPYPH